MPLVPDGLATSAGVRAGCRGAGQDRARGDGRPGSVGLRDQPADPQQGGAQGGHVGAAPAPGNQAPF